MADRLLIIGASGLLGSNLATELSQDYEVFGTHQDHPVWFNSSSSLFCDVTNLAGVDGVINSVQPKWIVHCAAATNVDWCEAHPCRCFDINVEGARHVAASAQRAGAGMLYVSTDAVFDGCRGTYAESDLPNPLNVYAKSKLAGEEAVLTEMPAALVVRTNIFGWNAQPKRSLAEWILDELMHGRPISGFADVIFNPLLVNDLSDLIARMLKSGLTGVYHAGATDSCSKFEFALALALEFAYDTQSISPVSIRSSTLVAPRPRNTTLTCTKLTADLGISPKDIKSGVRRFKTLHQRGYVDRLKAACVHRDRQEA